MKSFNCLFFLCCICWNEIDNFGVDRDVDSCWSTMKSLPERSSRGTRMHALEGAAMEADMQFWNQDFFKEESNDDDFSDSHGISEYQRNKR